MDETTEDLGDFEGEPATELESKVKAVKGLAGVGVRHRGDRVVLLVEAYVDNVAFEKAGADGLKRIQRLAPRATYVLEGQYADDAIREQRAKYRQAADEAAGRPALPFDDSEAPAQYVNAGGVVMLPAEIAELRGEVLLEADRELAVHFDDGAGGIWPDDWDGSGQSLAPIGGLMRPVNGAPGDRRRLVKLEDLTTGETLAEWTPADEAERLAALEAATALEEDLAAVAELEAGRRPTAEEPPLEDDPEAEAEDRYAGTPWPQYGSAKISAIKRQIAETGDPETLRHALAYEDRLPKARATIVRALEARLAALEGRAVAAGEDEPQVLELVPDPPADDPEARRTLEEFLAGPPNGTDPDAGELDLELEPEDDPHQFNRDTAEPDDELDLDAEDLAASLPDPAGAE